MPLYDNKWCRRIDKDGILGKYSLIFSLSAQNVFKSAFLSSFQDCHDSDRTIIVSPLIQIRLQLYTFCVSNVITLHVFPASYFAGLRSLAFETNFS